MKTRYFFFWILCFAGYESAALDLKMTEVLFGNTRFPDADGEYFPWVELRNFSLDTLTTDDFYLTDNINAPRTWSIPSFSIDPGQYVIIWFSGKHKIDSLGIHLDATLTPSTKTLALYNESQGYFADVFSIDYLPEADQSVGRFPEMNDEWILYPPDLVSQGRKNPYPGNWQQLAEKTNFSARDNNPNAALVYKNQSWLLAGETRDEDGVWTPVTDIWRSGDGVKWELVNEAGPYRHISSFLVFKEKMWAFDEHAYSSGDGLDWTMHADKVPFEPFYTRVIKFRDHLINVTDRTVYKSMDGENWEQIEADAPWDSRELFHLIDFKDTLWLLGGVANYYTDSTIHYNDIWYSTDGSEWNLMTDNAPWEGRLWPIVMVYNDKLWLMGGWNYYYDSGYYSHYGNFNDVWVYTYGGKWEKFETDVIWSHRHAMYSVIHQNQLFLFAGYGGGGVANLHNDVWKLDLRKPPVLEINPEPLVYGDSPFKLSNSKLPVRYFTDTDGVVFAENDESVTIRGAGTGRVLMVQQGNEYYYPGDTLVDVHVRKKELMVSVGNYEQKYRGKLPEFEISYEGFAYDDDENTLRRVPRAYTTATELSPVGEYAIEILTEVDNNYEFVTDGGTLTISEQSIVGFYPVPSTGLITLSTAFDLSPTASLEIRSIGGAIVKQLPLSPDVSKLTFDFSNLPKGIYCFVFRDVGFLEVGKFIIH